MSDSSETPPDGHTVLPAPPLLAETERSGLQRALQSTLFWGCVGLAGAIIVTVVATMIHDIRWMLSLAWPFSVFAAWEFARTCSNKGTIIWASTVLSAIAAGAALGWLYLALPRADMVAVTNAPAS